jgi:flagellar biosynthesis/type III secretory pathway protein FliH
VPGLDRYRPQISYLLLDEGMYSEPQLASLQNLAAAVFRLEKSHTPAIMVEVLAALSAWLKAPEQASLRRAFTEWLRQVLLPARLPDVELPVLHELGEVQTMLSERVKEWTEQWKQQGLQEGRREGLQEGRQEGRQEGLQEGRKEGSTTRSRG